MKTVLVTTSYLGDEERVNRLHKWLSYYTYGGIAKDLKFDAVIVLDNASPFERLKEFTKGYGGSYSGVLFQRFTEHFGRPLHYDYKYLWRAVDFYQELFKEYDKIIYMDNDFYVLTPKMVNWINLIDSGWHSPWCIRHNFPETGLQVIVKGDLKYALLHPFMKNNGECMEKVLPVQVQNLMMGNRHSENNELIQQLEWDFSAQVTNSMKIKYNMDSK